MSDKVFFDTTTLIYAISDGDSRAEVAEGLLSAGGCLSVQVLNEFAAVARRKLKMSWTEIAEALDAVRTLCGPAVPLTVETHEAGLRIAARYGYQIYDSLILAAALEAGCTVLYSEDMQDGQKIEIADDSQSLLEVLVSCRVVFDTPTMKPLRQRTRPKQAGL